MALWEKFSLVIHHGGKYVDSSGTRFYLGGEKSCRHNFDSDAFGYFDLRDEIRDLGYESWKSLAYKLPGDDFRVIHDDKDTTEMVSFIVTKNVKVFNIYVESEKRLSSENLEGNRDSGGSNVGNMTDVRLSSVVEEWEFNESDAGSDDSEYRPDEDEFGQDSDVDVILEEKMTGEGGHEETDDVGAGSGGNADSSNLVMDPILGDDCDNGDDNEGVLSDYVEEDDAMHDTTDEECESGRRRSQKVYYDPKCNHNNMEVVLGMRFEDGIQCRDGLRHWAICQGHPIQFSKVTKTMLIAKCVKPCEWRCYGSVNSSEKNFIIRTLPHKHTCPFDIHNKVADYKWIGRQYIDDFRVRPDMSISDFLEDCNKRFGVQPSRGRLHRAKHYALELLRGTVKYHYGLLRNYIAELVRVDREGRFELMLGDEAVFKGLYIGFSALKKGFMAGCRSVIGLDGCHLKTHLGGQLLCATATDANNQMFPVAWAVVAVENEFYWSWFLQILLNELGIRDGNGFTFMSDQQKGLLNAVRNLAPYAEHRNCARHVYNNWKKTHKGSTLMHIFWRAVRCTYQQQFDLAMDELKAEDVAVYEDFIERGLAKICKNFFSTLCVSDSVTNNISETFNGTIIRPRGKHIIHMLEDIRSHLRQRQYLKVEKMNKVKDILCPRIRKRLEELKQWARHCFPNPGLGRVFEVKNRDDMFTVKLGEKNCSCRSWELTGIPCIHALAAIHYMKEDASKYVSHYFTVETYKKAYSFGLPALNGEKMWPKANGNTVQPPLVTPMPGRPKKKRRKAIDETDPKNPAKLRKLGVCMTCQNCKQVGHNQRGCKEPEREKTPIPQAKSGRPRKNPSHPASSNPSQPERENTPREQTKRGRPKKNPSHPASSNPSQTASSNPSTTNVAEQRAINRDKRKARQGIGLFQSEDGSDNAYFHGSMRRGSVLQEAGASTSASTRSRPKQPVRRGAHSCPTTTIFVRSSGPETQGSQP